METTYECDRFNDSPNIESPVELKETVELNHDDLSSKQRREEPLITELELWFSLNDIRIGIDGIKDDIYNDDVLLKIMFRIKILPQGKGLQSIFDLEDELQPDCEEDEFPPENISRNSYDSISNKELGGTITLAVGKREDGAVDVLKAYLNGIERRVSVDTGAGALSFITA